MNKKSEIQLYSEVNIEEVNWLWYPYIPFGKITLIQGDPGCGKSSLVMNLIADATRGRETYTFKETKKPIKVIYQCSEDGIADTIKPRLLMSGADCKQVGFLDEVKYENLTLDDVRLKDAVRDFDAKILVIDPIQAYIENTSDLLMASRARKIMRTLAEWANAYNCAVILVGHLSKRDSGNDIYKGLGSVDLVAAARSVLHVQSDGDFRIVKQVKNSLAPTGSEVAFRIDPDFGFKWEREYTNNVAERVADVSTNKKTDAVVAVITTALKDGDKTSNEMSALLRNVDCSERTIKSAKKIIGVNSYRKNGQWYWTLKKQI